MQNNSRKCLRESIWNNANSETSAGVSRRQYFISEECEREKWQDCAKNDAFFQDNNAYKYLQIFQAVCIVSKLTLMLDIMRLSLSLSHTLY